MEECTPDQDGQISPPLKLLSDTFSRYTRGKKQKINPLKLWKQTKVWNKWLFQKWYLLGVIKSMAAERHGLLMPRPPSHLSLKQLRGMSLKVFIFKEKLCFVLTVMSCINIFKFLTKKVVRFWCMTCLVSPWILSSRAAQKQTGWWERPPGPLWRLSTTCVWTPGHFHELHPGSGGCDHHSDSRCVNWIEEFLSVWFQGSFRV